MAKYGKTLAEVLVQINGTSQTKKVLETLTQSSKELGDKIKVARAEFERLAESGGGPAYDAKKKEIAAMVKEQSQLNRAINETKKFSQNVGDILNNMSNNNVSVLNRTKKTLEALLNSITPNTKKAQNQIEQLQKAIKQVTDEIARRKGQLVDLEKVMGNLGKATPKQLDDVEKRLQSMLDSVTKNSNAWRKYNKQMRLLQEEKGKRGAIQAQDIMGGNYTKTIEGTKEAIELLKKYQGTLDAADATAINAVTASINKMNAELETTARQNAEKVMANPFRFSPEEISEAIKYTEKLQASVKDIDAYHKLQLQIDEAKRARDEFAENSKYEVMVAQFGQLEKLSVSALAEQKKYWEAMRDSGQYFDNPIKNLEKIAKLEQERLKKSANKVMGGDYTHTIEGTQQAIKLLEKYQGTLDATDTKNIEAVTDAINKMNAELETAARERVEKVMQNPIGFSPEQINEAIKYTEKLQAATPDGKEWTEYAKQIAAAKEARDKFASDAKFEIMSEQFKQFDSLSKEAAEQQTKYWEGLAKSISETDPRYQTVLDNIQKIKDSTKAQLEGEAFKVMGGDYTKTIEGSKQAIELLKKYQETLDATDADSINLVNEAIREMNAELDTAAKKSARETLTTNLNTAGTEDIKKAVEWLTKYQGTLKPLSQEWREINKEIEAGNDRLKAVSDRTKLDAMTDQFRNLNKLSTAALVDQQKYWQSVLDNAQKGTAAYIQAERKLQAISQETTARREAQAGSVMGDLANHSVAEIQEAIKMTEQLRDAQKAGSAEYEIYNNEIKQAKEYLQSYIDLNKQADMEDKWNNLTTLSANALAEQKKYWQEMVNGAKQGSLELQTYQDKLKEVIEEEQFRLDNKYIKVATNPDQYSVRELEEAIKHFEKLRDEQRLGSGEWDYYASMVNRASEQLKAFKDGAKLDAMEKQFADLSNLSVNAFAEQKKYWQGLRDSLEATDPLYTKAIDNLKQISDLENSRIKTDATQAIFDAKFGGWDKSVEETEKAIKLIEEYKKQLKTKSEADVIDDANKAIEILNANLGKAKESLMGVGQALNISEQLKIGDFDGTTEEILRAKKALEEFRKTLKLKGDSDEIERIDEALVNLSRSAELGGKNLRKIDEVLGDLRHASMDELQTAAKQLQAQLESSTRNLGDYIDKARELRRVNREIERARQEWERQESLFTRMTKRLSVYMAAYGSLSFIVDKVKEFGRANLQLSDSIADVAKTTGLESNELAKLGQEIRAIDTRTAQEQLYELAATAGQLGIKSETEIAGFVRAANMITVSLNELGTEATTQLMKIATLTGEAQEGTEKALLSIGSAINELTASSAAAAGPIVDLMNRMGGIAAQSGITSAQMAAIGATADALGQSVEITGTSMNKFLATLMSNSDQIAYALNMDAKALRYFINEGKTMEAVIAVFERMNSMGGLGALAPVMGELGSEGARMTQVLAAMAEKVDFLKGQLEISTEAYDKAISIQKEYNVKNENAIAILQRMGNALMEIVVNNVAVDIITAILRGIYNFGLFLKDWSAWAKMAHVALTTLTVALITMRIEWVETVNRMKIGAAFQAVITWLKDLTLGTISFTTAWKNLGKALKTNWFSVLIGAVVALGTWLIRTANHVSEVAKATAKYNRELQEETDKVDTLFNSLKRLQSTEADRAKTINAINNQYSQYLGFMLDEKDSAEKLAAAHQLINAELRKRMALNLRTTLEGTASNTYAEQLEKSSASIGKAVEKLRVSVNGEDQKERSVTTREVMRLVTKTINERVAKDASVSKEQLLSEIKTAMTEAYRRTEVSNTGKQYTVEVGLDLYEDIEDHIEDLIDSRVEFQKKVLLAEDQANVELEQLTKDALEARKNFLKQTESEINNAKKLTANLEKELETAKAEAGEYGRKDESKEAVTARQNYELKEQELRDHYKKMVDNANDYVDATRKLMEEHNESLTEDDKKRMNEEIKMYQDFARETAKLVPGMDPWDKGRDVKDWREFSEIVTNLDTSSAKALAAAFKKIKDEAALFPDDIKKVYELFQAQGVDEISLEKLGLTDSKSVAELVFDWEKQIREKLKTKFHRNTTLGFIFDEGNDRDMKSRVRQDYQAAMAALEAFYKEYEDFIRQNRANMVITESDMNRQLLDNTRKYNEDKQQLIKKFLGEENTFNQKQYTGVLTGYDYFSNKDLDKMAEQYQKWGDAMTDGGRNQMAKAGAEISKAANKEQEKIKNELLKGDLFASFKNNFAEMLDELGALTSAKEDEITNTLNDLARKSGSKQIWGLSDEERTQRIAVLTKFADKSYSLKADSLKSEMLLETNNALWVQRMNDEEMQLLLEKLRNYYDDRLNLTKKYQEKLEKEFESYYQQTGKQGEYESKQRNLKGKKTSREQFEELGGKKDYSDIRNEITEGAKIEGSKLAEDIDFQKEKLNTLKKGSEEYLATEALITDKQLELNDILAQSQRDLTQVYMEEWNKRAEKWGEVGEMFGDFLGEQVMLEKKANDARARGDLETAKKIEQQQKENKQNLIKGLLNFIVDEAALWAKELGLKMMFNAMSLADDKKRAIEEATTQGKSSMLSIFLSALTGQATEAKKGLPGLITGAVVFAATMALQAMAKSAIANMFPEAEIGSTGNRKLSTGMLTYAKGNYPVLGNDGKVYDAKYEGAGLKTGVYGGGAHFGIFSEKQPEMIVDGKTTQKLILNYPYIYDAITTIAKNGRLVNAMPTFATGDYPAGMKPMVPIAAVEASAGSNEQMERTNAVLEQATSVIRELSKVLTSGQINANIDPYANRKATQRAEKFMKRRGIG